MLIFIIIKRTRKRPFEKSGCLAPRLAPGNHFSKRTPISSDEEVSQTYIHVSGFGIRIYPNESIRANEDRSGSFFN